jgi:sugar phosphate isomerase/epimerase
MTLSRRELMAGGLAAGAGALAAQPSLAWMLAQKGMAAKVGATDWNLRQEAQPGAFELAKRLKLQGVQVSLTDRRKRDETPKVMALYEAAAHREAARQNGVAITSTCLNILHVNYLKSDKLGQKWVAESIPITKAMDTKVILLPFFGNGALKTRGEMTYVADYLKEIGPEAEKAGVILGLEDTISAEDNMYMVERASSPAVKVYYDVGNSTNNGFDIYKEIRWLGKDNICEIHIKDNPHYLGEGKIDFEKVVDAIADIGFKEWLVLETDCPSRDVEADFRINIRNFNKALARREAEESQKNKRKPKPFDVP